VTEAEQRSAETLVVARELGLERAVRDRPESEIFLILLRGLEERGVTLEDITAWSEECDFGPARREESVECFRARAHAELEEPQSLAMTMAAAGGVAFVVFFLWARR
jgi:hypothetical protein